VVPAAILQKLFDAGRLGQKWGRGFFDYGPAKGSKPPRGTDSAEVGKFLTDIRGGKERKFKPEEITDRLFLPMLLEATRVLEDKLVGDPRDVDLALIFGIGFPPFKGGLFFWADQVGTAKIAEKLQAYTSLGKRFEPTKLFTKVAHANGKFYD